MQVANSSGMRHICLDGICGDDASHLCTSSTCEGVWMGRRVDDCGYGMPLIFSLPNGNTNWLS